ncbi:MAG: diacylglycerol kinase family protein [Legionella sp.]|nr:diacylglycerol kinase family protein [Legionella sp.]
MDSIGIVINNKAKNAASLDPYLDALSKSELPYKLYKTEPQNLNGTLKKAVKDHAILLIGGGDGSIRSAAQYCSNSSTILGVIPLGTMNHFAKELGLPANAPELVQAIRNKKTITIDVAEVNGLIFVNNSSIGFYPVFARKRQYYAKFYNKWLSYIPGFIEAWRSHDSFSIIIKNKNLNRQLTTSFFMISNNLYTFEFPLTTERNSFNKSQLGIYYFKYGKIQLSKIIHYFFNKKNSFDIKKTSDPVEVYLENQEEITISLDGETMVTKNPLTYKSVPEALRLLTNKP